MMKRKYLYDTLLVCLFSGFSLSGMQLVKRKSIKKSKVCLLRNNTQKYKNKSNVVVKKLEQPVECLICFEEETKQIIPCPNGSQHSDSICNDCLVDCKAMSDLCPICRGLFSLGCLHGKAKADCDVCNEPPYERKKPSSKGLGGLLLKLCIFWSCYK